MPASAYAGAACRFSTWYATQTTPATLVDGHNGTVAATCPSSTGSPGTAELQLALNGHDWEPAPAPLVFGFYRPPVLRLVVPAGAPPGTAVQLIGANLGGGESPGVTHSCRFGGVVVPGVLQAEGRVINNAHWEDTVRCVVPRGIVGRVRLSVSLNGQQYTEEDVKFAVAPEA